LKQLKKLHEKSDKELDDQLTDMRKELSRLRILSARGTLAKESGKIKGVRRNVARVMTEMRRREIEGGRSD
jgi:large subunit ribosomal protein L29